MTGKGFLNEFRKRRVKWDKRFLHLARFVAAWSKDPSTKTGAVITEGNRVVSVGFNGFAQNVDDSPEKYAHRPSKYRKVVHGEVNAILFSQERLRGYTLYTWPFMPCSPCAAIVIQKGIIRVVAPKMSVECAKTRKDAKHSWKKDCALASEQFKDAGVELVLYDFTTKLDFKE